jgi:hypothetical protein
MALPDLAVALAFAGERRRDPCAELFEELEHGDLLRGLQALDRWGLRRFHDLYAPHHQWKRLTPPKYHAG